MHTVTGNNKTAFLSHNTQQMGHRIDIVTGISIVMALTKSV